MSEDGALRMTVGMLQLLPETTWSQVVADLAAARGWLVAIADRTGVFVCLSHPIDALRASLAVRGNLLDVFELPASRAWAADLLQQMHADLREGRQYRETTDKRALAKQEASGALARADEQYRETLKGPAKRRRQIDYPGRTALLKAINDAGRDVKIEGRDFDRTFLRVFTLGGIRILRQVETGSVEEVSKPSRWQSDEWIWRLPGPDGSSARLLVSVQGFEAESRVSYRPIRLRTNPDVEEVGWGSPAFEISAGWEGCIERRPLEDAVRSFKLAANLHDVLPEEIEVFAAAAKEIARQVALLNAEKLPSMGALLEHLLYPDNDALQLMSNTAMQTQLLATLDRALLPGAPSANAPSLLPPPR